MKNLKVAKKLIVGFLIMILISVIIGVMGIWGMWSICNSANDMYEYNLIAISAMGDLRELFANERNDMRRIFLDREDPEAMKATIDKFAEYDKMAEEYFERYELTITDITQEKDYLDAKEAWTGPFANMKKEMWMHIANGDIDSAYDMFTNGSAVIAPITSGFAASSKINNSWAEQAKEGTFVLFSTLLIAQIAALIVAVISACLLSMHISNLISKPLMPLTKFMNKAGTTGEITLEPEDVECIEKYSRRKDEIGQVINSAASFVKRMLDVSHLLENVANGDLSTELSLLSNTDTMGLSLQKMNKNLNGMFANINASAAQVSAGSKQISDGAQSLAQGATEQAASIEELSASISEIAEQTKQNANIAKEAAVLSDTIRGNAEKGNAQMNQMMQAVREINEASNQISKVIKVIDDIAFQTNILALNAAVEAARAGQHGKGFAVVAEEVRNLAAKSAEAAKDTGELIENSIEKANFGLNVATETAISLKDIVEGINRSAEIVAQIAQSSDKQAGDIGQINIGIDQVSQVVQQNSATAEESAAASEEMTGQANTLGRLISQFKLKVTDGRPSPVLLSTSGKKNLDASGQPMLTMGGNNSGEYGKY